jgi:hypothetical protein
LAIKKLKFLEIPIVEGKGWEEGGNKKIVK